MLNHRLEFVETLRERREVHIVSVPFRSSVRSECRSLLAQLGLKASALGCSIRLRLLQRCELSVQFVGGSLGHGKLRNRSVKF